MRFLYELKKIFLNGERWQLSRITIKNLTKYFGDLFVLDDISFSLNENEFLCICGPTGCGKTTLLNILAGFIPATNGLAMFGDLALNPQEHNISFVFQEPSCLPWKNVLANVKFGLEIKNNFFKLNINEKEINEKTEEIINLVGLRDFKHYFPNQLSTGMKQMVAIARELAVNPDLLLMDEPFSALDAQTRWMLHIKLLEIWSKLKKTVLFVTHNVEEAVYLADRIIILSKRPAQIIETINIELERPRNKLSPEFIKYREGIIDLLNARGYLKFNNL